MVYTVEVRKRSRKPGDTVRAIGYVRVSTAEQAVSGLGLDAQRASIRAACEARGWQLVAIHEDAGISGAAIAKRPALATALDALAAGHADVLMAHRLDRVSRSVFDLSGLLARAQREGWRTVFLECGLDTTTPHGEAMVGVSAVFSQLERRLISQRTSAALQSKKAAGVRLGRPRSLPVAVVERVVAEREAGATLAAIADGLTTEAVDTAQGGARWYASTVAAVLRSAELDRQAA
jgi:DNA invertase Pin-like site-specific DNA recombinase